MGFAKLGWGTGGRASLPPVLQCAGGPQRSGGGALQPLTGLDKEIGHGHVYDRQSGEAPLP